LLERTKNTPITAKTTNITAKILRLCLNIIYGITDNTDYTDL